MIEIIAGISAFAAYRFIREKLDEAELRKARRDYEIRQLAPPPPPPREPKPTPPERPLTKKEKQRQVNAAYQEDLAIANAMLDPELREHATQSAKARYMDRLGALMDE